MSNVFIKMQIRTWLENAIKKAQNPDPAERVKRERRQKAKKVANRFGL